MAIIYEAGEVEIFKKIFGFAAGLFSDTRNEYKKNKANIRNAGFDGLTRSSIMRASRDLVMSFPVLCTDTIQASTASMISKAIERNCITTLQLLFASANMTGNNGLEALQKWHKNFDNDMDMDDYLAAVDALASTAKVTYDNRNKIVTDFRNIKGVSESMIRECTANNNFFPESSFSESSVMDFVLESKHDGFAVIKEADKSYRNNPRFTQGNPFLPNDPVVNTVGFDKDSLVYDELDDEWKTYDQFRVDQEIRQAEYEKMNDKEKEAYRRQVDAAKQAAERGRFRIQKAYQNKQYELQKAQMKAQQKQNDIVNKLNRDKFDYQKQRDEIEDTFKRNNAQRELFQKQLLDSDIKKCNELVPAMMIVQYVTTNPDGTSIDRQFIAGVKTRLISCSSYEIIDRIKSIEKNKANMLNLVRATTKEISFCKDFVAGIEQAKIDAKRNSKLSKNSAIWRSLQDRATKSGIKRLKKNKANDAGAITTLVISEEEVNYMKKVEAIDLNNPAVAKSIMEAYNLMGLVIVDEQVEVAKFLFDGDRYYQEYAFNTLERESNDNSYKKVINLLSRNNI